MADATITPSKAKQLMEDSKGAFFTVMFIKKDGSYREMNARLGVGIGVNGTGRSFEPAPAPLDSGSVESSTTREYMICARFFS